MRKTLLFLVLLFVLGVGLIACSRSNEFDMSEYLADPSLFYGETLTITLDEQAYGMWRRTLSFAASYYEQRLGRGVNIEFLATDDLDFRLMVGDVGDLLFFVDSMFTNTVDWRLPSVNRMFLDIGLAMEQDPYFDEDDWYMELFNAFAMGGEMRVFPWLFDYRLTVGNDSIEPLVHAFNQLDGISFGEYLDLHRRYAAQTHYITFLDDITWFMPMFVNDFFCLQEGRADFDSPEFINILTQLSSFLPEPPSATSISMNEPFPRVLLDSYTFFSYPSVGHFMYTLPFEDAPPLSLTHPQPIVSADRELLIESRLSFAVNAATNPLQAAIAWDFMKFLASEFYQSDHIYSQLVLTAHRETRVHKYDRNLRTFWYAADGSQPGLFAFVSGGTRFAHETSWEAAEYLQGFIAPFLDRPMMLSQAVPNMVWLIVEEELMAFQNGFIPAATAAANIQNRVSLVLMEMD